MHAPLLHLHCTKVKLIKAVNVILKVICIPTHKKRMRSVRLS